MKKLSLIAILTIPAFVGLAACQTRTAPEVLASTFEGLGAQYDCVTHQGRARCAYVVAPQTSPKGMILALHPAFHSVARTEDIAQFAPKAVAAGYVVLFAEGIDKQWNDGRHAEEAQTFAEGIDDTGFLEKLVKKYQQKYNLTPAQTLSMGMSNGGMMTMRLLCQSEAVGAGVAVVANLPKGLSCTASPKPLTLVFGREDDVVKYAGGALSRTPTSWGEVESAKVTEAWFAARNGCTKPTTTRLDAIDDGTVALRRDYACVKAPLIVYDVAGMGHTWPSEPTKLYARLTGRGRITEELDGSDIVLNAAHQWLSN